jgi:hypothetical protein
MGNRVTNSELYREIGELTEAVKELRADIQELAPRIKTLELFKSYVTGGAAVVSAAFAAFIAVFKL